MGTANCHISGVLLNHIQFAGKSLLPTKYNFLYKTVKKKRKKFHNVCTDKNWGVNRAIDIHITTKVKIHYIIQWSNPGHSKIAAPNELSTRTRIT